MIETGTPARARPGAAMALLAVLAGVAVVCMGVMLHLIPATAREVAALPTTPAYAYDGAAAVVRGTSTIPSPSSELIAPARRGSVTAEATSARSWDFAVAAEDGLATESNLATVTTHLDSIGALASHPPNAAMVARIQDALSSGRALTTGEQNFMTHELTEANLMSRGVGQDLAHEMAGRTHPTFGNYDPEVIKEFPDYFNSNWRAYWGLPN